MPSMQCGRCDVALGADLEQDGADAGAGADVVLCARCAESIVQAYTELVGTFAESLSGLDMEWIADIRLRIRKLARAGSG